MTLRDRSDLHGPFWRAMFFTAVWLGLRLARFTYEEGLRDGKSAAWRDANKMLADHRTRYDPKPVSAKERRRRARELAERRW